MILGAVHTVSLSFTVSFSFVTFQSGLGVAEIQDCAGDDADYSRERSLFCVCVCVCKNKLVFVSFVLADEGN